MCAHGRLVRAPEFEPDSCANSNNIRILRVEGFETYVIRSCPNSESISSNKIVAGPTAPATYTLLKFRRYFGRFPF